MLRAAHFAGKVGVLGFYNPQGLQLPGSDKLQEAMNSAMETAITENKFGEGVVYANPMPTMNPQVPKKAEESELKHNEKQRKVEGKAICKYTEECNIHDQKKHGEEELGHEITEEEAKKHAGDIHPSPHGHKLFAKLLYEALTTGKSVK